MYVALLGFNAIAVIDVKTKVTKGLIPTGWGPTRVQLSKDETELYAISCRGYGAGPNGGDKFVSHLKALILEISNWVVFIKLRCLIRQH
ncbi:MAG: hypothetical protein IPI77_17400 [Saprospiraceae bacterium]|nr:hypothetical protein [Saprospiraceae bacterium]